MSSFAYFSARRLIANAGSARARLIQNRTNVVTNQTSQFRTWTKTKNVFSQKASHAKAIAGGAALVVAGVAMYPSGRHALYPGIPIPVTSLNHGDEKSGGSEVKLIVVEKLDEPKKDLIQEPKKIEEKVEEAIEEEPKITTPGKETETEHILEDTTPKSKSIPTDEISTQPEVSSPSKTVQEVKEVPDKVPYLLIGAGTASFAAYRAIKAKDPTAKILIVGDENRLPYMRPPLSKELWYPPLEEVEEDGKTVTKLAPTVAIDDAELKFRQWNGRERSLYYEKEQFYTPTSKLENRENGGISVLKGRRVEKVDSKNQIAYLDDGTEIGYDKCLIATGGNPRNLDVLKSNADVNQKVTLFRKVEDFFKLNEITQKIKSISIIGGGFLGSELACALGGRGQDPRYDLKVTQIYRENGNMAKVLPEYLSDWTTEKVKAEGVNIINNVEVKSAKIDETTGKVSLTLNDGQKLDTDHVVVAVGIEPEITLAEKSGLDIDNTLGGFKVNEELEAKSNIWVAGDAACFYDPQLGRRRVEHHDHAVVSGRLAGENMTGSHKAYTHQSMFWSDLGPDVGYEAIGLVDSKLPTVGVFAAATEKDTPKGIVSKTDESMRSESEANVPESAITSKAATDPPGAQENYGKGVIFYLNNDIVVGILMWNVFNKMNIARKVIKEHKHYDDLSEVAKLFNIHANDE